MPGCVSSGAAEAVARAGQARRAVAAMADGGGAGRAARHQPFARRVGRQSHTRRPATASPAWASRRAAQGGALLALPAGDARGMPSRCRSAAVARGVQHRPGHRIRAQPEQRGLYPFFFQDRFRSYFVRPIYAGLAAAAAASPCRCCGRRAIARATRAAPAAADAARCAGPAPRAGAPARPRPGARTSTSDRSTRRDRDAHARSARRVGGRAGRSLASRRCGRSAAATEAEAASVRRQPRQPRPPRAAARRGRGARAPRRAPAVRAVARPSRRWSARRYHESKLQFTPFEHPDTCRLIEHAEGQGHRRAARLQAPRGRARAGITSSRPDGIWARAAAELVRAPLRRRPARRSQRSLPHLDVGFENDHPYGALQLGAVLPRPAAGRGPAGQGRPPRGSAALVPLHLRPDDRLERAEPAALLAVSRRSTRTTSTRARAS